MTTTQIALNLDAELVILAYGEHAEAVAELQELNARDCVRVAVVIDELLGRGLLVQDEPGEAPYPTIEAERAALTQRGWLL
jgi:hypothetical protein